MSDSKSFFIIISEDPYTSEKAYAGLRFALTALVQEHKVKVFLLGPAVVACLKDQNPQEGPNIQKWLQDIHENGGKIVACGVCCKRRGITKEKILDFIPIGSMGDLVEAAAEADRQLIF